MTHRDDDDPTGMRDLLRSLSDSGPMPDDLVARITSALADEQQARTVIPLRRPAPRWRAWPRYAAAAAVTGIALTGGGVALRMLTDGSMTSAASNAGVEAASQAAAASPGERTGGEAATSSGSAAAVPGPSVTKVAGAPLTRVTMSERAYAVDALAESARDALSANDVSLRDFAAESPAVGPIGTPRGARDCASALGIASTAAVLADLGTSAGMPVALVVATAPDGARTAYLVERDCRLGDPGLLAGPVSLAS